MAVLNFYHLKDGRLPDNAVYIGRAQPHKGLAGSPFANPFKLTDFNNDRAAVLARYQAWLWEQLQTKKLSEAALLELAGKDLVCFCAPKTCHGDVLTKAIAWAQRRETERLAAGVTVEPTGEREGGTTTPAGSRRVVFKPERV